MDGIEVSYPSNGVAVVALHGEHDVLTKDAFASLLAGEVAGHELVVIDVSDAVFIDSSFIHNLVRADRAATAGGSRFVLQMGTAHIVRRTLEVSGLLNQLDVASTRAEAVAPGEHVAGSGFRAA